MLTRGSFVVVVLAAAAGVFGLEACGSFVPTGAPQSCEAGQNCGTGDGGLAPNPCPAGQQDNDRDGVCSAACGTVPCGLHEQCDDATGTARCACVVGYEKSDATCRFVGGPKDPKFQGTPADAWQITGGTLEPAATEAGATKLLDPGMEKFTAETFCQGSAGVLQTFTMPAYSDAEGLALNAHVLSSELSPTVRTSFILSERGRFLAGRVVDRFGDGVSSCLGAKWFGKSVALKLRGQCRQAGGGSSEFIAIDHLSLDPRADCPRVGEITNADFNTQGGWKLQPNGGGTVEVRNGEGIQGSAAAVIESVNCSDPLLLQTVSLPETKNLALSFSYRGAKNQTLATNFGTVEGTGAFERATMCIPEGYRGEVVELRFSARPIECTTASGPARFTLDDVQVAPDPSCASVSHFADPGFELAGAGRAESWRTNRAFGFERGGGRVGGRSGLLVVSSANNFSARLETDTSFPPEEAGKGPALKFWAKGSLLTGARVSVSIFGPGSQVFASFSSSEVQQAWTQKTVCLTPGMALAPAKLNVTLEHSGGTNSSQVNIDDFEMTTDASCPTAAP